MEDKTDARRTMNLGHPDSPGASCDLCVYYGMFADQIEGAADGYCDRYPPPKSAPSRRVGEFAVTCNFPETWALSYCGEFRTRKHPPVFIPAGDPPPASPLKRGRPRKTGPTPA